MRSVILKDKSIITSLIWRSTKWHLRYLFTKKPLPLACNLYITNRCNFKCSFCNVWRKPTPTDMSLSKVKNLIDSLNNSGCLYLSVTGGEPLLVEHLFDVLMYARRSRITYIHLVTNGSLLDTDKAVMFQKSGINEISISIDGTEKIHDRNRGVAGAYSKAIIAIENLKKYAPGVKIVLNAILSPENPFECLHTVELACKFKVYAKVQPLNQHPILNNSNYSVISIKGISPSHIKEVIAKLRRQECIVNSSVFLDNIYNFFFQKKCLVFIESPCLFGYHHIEILEDGSIFPCLEGLNWQNGIDSNLDLEDVLQSSRYQQLLEKLKKCKGCARNYYICYYEPRITFPINNFLKSFLRK